MALVGVIQATETIKLILGGEPLIRRLLLIDALAMKFRELKLRKNPDCPTLATWLTNFTTVGGPQGDATR